MKTAFFEVKEDWEKKEILKRFKDKKEILIFKESLNEIDLNLIKDIEIISVFIYSNCNENILKKLKKLKLISTRSTGFDHIDTNHCKKSNIQVVNVPHYGENTVAEFTFALLLAISRKLINSINRVKTGTFDFAGLRGFDLEKKTIGIVGFGNIGQKFAKMCKGFEMNIIAYDPFAENLKNQAEEIGVKFTSLENLYKISDIISLHMPLTKKTRHILKDETFNKMKKGVVILNTSRGDLIDSGSLLRALNSGKVSFAGLDVLEGEFMVKDELELLNKPEKDLDEMKIMLQAKVLISHPNVLVTPHNAFNTIDALMRILNTSIENINDFKNKKQLKNLIS